MAAVAINGYVEELQEAKAYSRGPIMAVDRVVPARAGSSLGRPSHVIPMSKIVRVQPGREANATRLGSLSLEMRTRSEEIAGCNIVSDYPC